MYTKLYLTQIWDVEFNLLAFKVKTSLHTQHNTQIISNCIRQTKSESKIYIIIKSFISLFIPTNHIFILTLGSEVSRKRDSTLEEY